MNQRTIYLNLLAATRLVTDCIIAYKELHPEVIFRLVQDPSREHDDICISTAFPGEFKRTEDHLLLRERFFMAVPADSAEPLLHFLNFRTKALSACQTTGQSDGSAIVSAWRLALLPILSVKQITRNRSET